jgi:hypothetical protein
MTFACQHPILTTLWFRDLMIDDDRGHRHDRSALNIVMFSLTINLNALRLIGEMRNRADPDDEDLPARYLLYVFAVMVAIAIAAVSTFFILISR